MAANEGSTVGAMRTINIAQVTYAETFPKAGFACSLLTLGEAGIIDSSLADGKKSGYIYAIVDCRRKDGIVVGYTSAAWPISSSTGTRFWCSDESGVIKWSSIDATNCLRMGTRLQ